MSPSEGHQGHCITQVFSLCAFQAIFLDLTVLHGGAAPALAGTDEAFLGTADEAAAEAEARVAAAEAAAAAAGLRQWPGACGGDVGGVAGGGDGGGGGGWRVGGWRVASVSGDRGKLRQSLQSNAARIHACTCADVFRYRTGSV